MREGKRREEQFGMAATAVAYLTSEYPGISHTFIFREVESLRAQGIPVLTATINPARHLDRMTEAEREEAARTLVLKHVPAATVLRDAFAVLARDPAGTIRMLRAALGYWLHGPLDFMRASGYFTEAVILREWMRRNGVRHVHVHFGNPAATVALIAEHAGGLEFSLSLHGPDIFYEAEQEMLAEKVRRAVFTRCISHYCRSQAQRLVPFDVWDRFPIVRCGVDPTKYAPRPEPNNAVPEILCVGRLVPAKGQHVLLQACRILRDRGVALHLTYVGDGPDRESLERLAQRLELADGVEFTGAVGQDAVHTYYDRADVFVLPSFAEGLPVVLMEAMAKGIPCVSTRITGIPELIDDGVNGFLVAASDVDGLAGRIEAVLGDPELRRRFAEAGRATVEREYDAARNGAQMANCFRRYALNPGEEASP